MPDDPLPSGNPEALGFALKPLEHLDHLIREHLEEGRYPGAQIALARNGQLALSRSYGEAKTEFAAPPANLGDCSDSWYHAAAIEDEKNGRDH